MGKIIGVVFAGVVLLLVLVIMLNMSASMLASSMANLAMSTALLTSQCVMGFVVLLAVISTALSVLNFAIMAQRRNAAPQMPPPVAYPVMQAPVKPYPAALPQLPAGQPQHPMLYVAGEPVEIETEADDVLFANWGW